MRRIMIGCLGMAVLVVSGCGGGKTFANQPRPAVPVNLTVYIDDARVSVSPESIGAGPIVFIVTNQSSHAESLQIQPEGASTSLAHTGPINPQGTAEVKVDSIAQGEYTVGTSTSGNTDASQALGSPIQPAHLHIGAPRPSASNQVLQP
jgi:hypothetical protein